MSIINDYGKYIAGTYSRFPVTLVEGKGATAWDIDGKEYIDLGSGIGVNSFGWCDDEWIFAVEKQLDMLQHTSNLFYTLPGLELAKLLCKKSGMEKCFFGNSGAEANECAVKTARKYSLDKYGDPERNVVVTLKSSFHGRTLATLAATGQDAFHTTFGPFPQGFVYADAGDFELFRAAAEQNGKVCAVMMEMIQGEGGVNVLEKDYVRSVVDYCRENDILVIVDEVQTGNGRTGKFYSYQHFGFVPDLVSTAKGVAGGLPMGVCLFGEKVKDVMTPGSHGSTFGMNPVVCAGAVSVVKRMDDEFLASVTAKGEYIRERLSACRNVTGISGMGLMLGVETPRDAKEVVSECIAAGALPLTAKNKIRLLPPLNITEAELEKAMDILVKVLSVES
ncbi:MAG: aspartate aminotransferase family protein [Clostridia bacterium]|nr:aspartate aminotransferase family protein [Clostridia bacterium]